MGIVEAARGETCVHAHIHACIQRGIIMNIMHGVVVYTVAVCVCVCVCIIMCGRWCSASTDEDDMEELKYEYYNVRACVRTCICECCSLCVRAHGHEDGWKRSDWQRWHWGRIQSPDISLQPLRLSLSLSLHGMCGSIWGCVASRMIVWRSHAVLEARECVRACVRVCFCAYIAKSSSRRTTTKPYVRLRTPQYDEYSRN